MRGNREKDKGSIRRISFIRDIEDIRNTKYLRDKKNTEKKRYLIIVGNKLWTKLRQAQGRSYVLISLVLENLDPKLLYKLKDKHDKNLDKKLNRLIFG